jgi:hypothetical protein
MFFYVNDVIFAYKIDRQKTTDQLIARFNKMFEFRNLEEIKHFLEIRVIIQNENDDKTVYLVQDAYVDKLMKEYEIRKLKMQISFSSSCTLIKYDEEIDQQRMYEYRQKVRSICYSATMTRSDIIKTTSKLIEFLINSESDHLIAANHCMKYLQNIKYLIIKYIAFDENELTITIENKHVFEIIVDVSFANENDRKWAEEYAFKLFEELIDWTAKKQVTVFTSIIEAELLILLHDAKKYIWRLHLFKKLKFDSNQNLIIYENNLQTIRLMKSKIVRIDIKFKYINVAQCWFKEMI